MPPDDVLNVVLLDAFAQAMIGVLDSFREAITTMGSAEQADRLAQMRDIFATAVESARENPIQAEA